MSADHSDCLSVARSRADSTGLDLAIQAFPFADTYPEFPVQKFTCPHGLPYWMQPTPDEAARLRALNQEATR